MPKVLVPTLDERIDVIDERMNSIAALLVEIIAELKRRNAKIEGTRR